MGGVMRASSTFRSFVALVAVVNGCFFAAHSTAKIPQPVPPKLAAESATALPITAYARRIGVSTCLAKLEAMETNLFQTSEYSFRAFSDEREANARAFTAIVDSRRVSARTRALTNITVVPNAAASCTVMYEQTVYHARHCDLVQKEMAPKAISSTPSLGAVILDVSKTLTLTIIPVGDAQCVTIIKEIAY